MIFFKNKPESEFTIFDWYIKVIFQNYANFNGRARRKEYWSFLLVHNLIVLTLLFLTAIITYFVSILDGQEFIAYVLFFFMFIVSAFIILSVIPEIAVAVRRLHNTNNSGWMYLLHFIPFGSIVLLIFLFSDSKSETNKYGPDPKNPHFDDINEIGMH